MQESLVNLMFSMVHRAEVHIVQMGGETVKGVCNQIQAEDGSGSSFNVTLDSGDCIYLKRPIGIGTRDCPIRPAPRK